MNQAIRRAATAVFMVLSLLAVSGNVLSQSYPNRPIRLIAPTPPGTVTDTVMRVLAAELEKDTGATFIIDNRPGGLGVIGTEAMMLAPPDGYTFLASAISTHAQNPFLVKNLRYDPIRDFEPVSRLILVQWLLVSDPALKFKDFRELIASAKSKPGSLSFGYGATSALASASAFNKMFGIEALPVPYKGQSLALVDIAAGRVSYMLIDASSAASLIKDGKVQALAVASETRTPLLPNVPTFKELGVSGVDFVGWLGLHAPAKTPAAARQWMSEHMQKVLTNPAVVERLKGIGVVPAHQNPEQFEGFVRSELTLWQKRISEAGLKPE